jgi:hypothetical protein
MAPIPKPAQASAPTAAPAPPAAFPFPTAALGPVLAPAITAVAARTQAAPELVAHHILTLAAMAAQRLISVRLPTGQARPVSCFFASLVGTGEGRDAVEKLVVDSARLWEVAFEDEFPARVLRHVDEGCDTGVARPAPLAHLNLFFDPKAAVAPDRYRSYQRQSGLFARHPHDLIQPGAPRRVEASSLSALWNGKVVKPAVGAPVFPRLSVHLVASPRAGRAALSDADLGEAGLLGRLLVAAPASRVGTRTFEAAGNDDPPPEFDTLLTYIGELFEKPATADSRVIPFSKDAAAAWLAYAAEAEAALAPDGALTPIRAFAVRLREHAARLAAVLALMDDCGLEEVAPSHVESGIALARFYAEERLRLLNVASPALTPTEQEELLHEWLQRKPADEVITLREMCRVGPMQLRQVDKLYTLMQRMELRGIVQPANDSFGGAIAPRRPQASYAWRVVSDQTQSVA